MTTLADNNYREQHLLCCDNCKHVRWAKHCGLYCSNIDFEDDIRSALIDSTSICDKYKPEDE